MRENLRSLSSVRRGAVRLPLRRVFVRFAMVCMALALGIGGFADAAWANPTAPAQPAAPTVTTSLGTLSVAFVAPADGGSPITGYSVDCTSGDGGTEGSGTGISSPIVVSGVTNEDDYTCTVTATNGVGDSSASPASSSLEVANVPAAPAQPTGTGGSNGDISVAFTAPDDGGSAITGYSADCASGDGGVENSNTGASSPIDVTGLTGGDTDYTCTVTATNAQGTSAASPASAAVTVPATAPPAPGVDDISLGQNAVTIDFSPSGTGGSAITGYTATCSSGDGGTTRTGTAATSPITVSSLTNGDDYSCTVDATNAIGTSAESSASDTFTAITVPDPLTITGVTLGANSATVSVAENGSDGSDPIELYTVSCSSSNGGTHRSALSFSSPVTVSPLSNGKTYTCTATATNDAGTSTASSASSSFVAATVPGAPTITGVTQGNNSAIVAFTLGSTGGSAVTSFGATCISGDGGTTQSGSGGSSPVTVGGLTNGADYTCTVTATNEIGPGAASAASSSFAVASVPGAPTVTGITLEQNAVSVAFTPGADGGSAITNNTVTCVSSDGGATRTGSGASSPVTVSTLTNGNTYSCTVTSTNAVGTGSASTASSSFIAAVLPSSPTVTGVTPGNNDDVSVAFTAGADGGSAITSFTATCSSSDGGTTQSNTGASSPIAVSSLSNGNNYTCTVLATNAVGDGSASAASSSFLAATPPAAPTLNSVTPGNNSASVAFTAGATGGSAITGFSASCASSNGGTTQSNTGASSPIVVSSLTNGDTYSCTVTATNAEGTSAASNTSGSFPALTVPGAPTLTGVTLGTDAGIVAFTAGSNGGGPIEAYTATCTSSDGGVTQSAIGTSSPITVGSLTSGNTYTCTVLAINVIGDSPASSASTTFVAGGAPGAPTITGVTPSSGSASVAFTAGSNGGSAITGFSASCTSSNGGAAGSNTGASSPIVVGSLTNGDTYTCTVLATNGAGNSPASTASSSFTVGAVTVPSAPTGVSVTRGQNSASVAFTASASNGGSAITGYTASCSSTNGGATRTGTGASSPITVTTLTQGDTYTCTVLATNGAGNSPASTASSSFTAATVPGAPVFTAGTVTHPVATSATVPFTAPASNGGSPITSYTVTCPSSDGGTTVSASGASSPLTVTNMTAGKTYTCTITATNAIGTSSPSTATAAYVA